MQEYNSSPRRRSSYMTPSRKTSFMESRRLSLVSRSINFDSYRFAVEFATAVDLSYKDLKRPNSLIELSEAYQQFMEREHSGIAKGDTPLFATAVKCLEEMNYLRATGSLDAIVYFKNYMFPGVGDDPSNTQTVAAPKISMAADTRFFMLKAPCMTDIRSSVKHGKWSVKAKTRDVLNQAYHQSSMVILIFSVNKSGFFQGYGKMISPIQSRRSNQWEKESGEELTLPFCIEWISTQPISFSSTDHISNQWNNGLPLRRCREGYEIPHQLGLQVCTSWRENAEKHVRQVSFEMNDLSNIRRSPRESEPRNARRKSTVTSPSGHASGSSAGGSICLSDGHVRKISVSDAEGGEGARHARRRSSLPDMIAPMRCAPSLVIPRLDWSDVSSNPDTSAYVYDIDDHLNSFEPLQPYEESNGDKAAAITVEDIDRVVHRRGSTHRSSMIALSEMQRKSLDAIRSEAERRSLVPPAIMHSKRPSAGSVGSAGSIGESHINQKKPVDLGEARDDMTFPPGMMKGVCVSWNPLQGYGFIRPVPGLIIGGEQRDVFVHAKNIRLPTGKRKLKARVIVEFIPNYVMRKDSLYATDLMPLDEEFTGEL